jgi:chaperonin GroEL
MVPSSQNLEDEVLRTLAHIAQMVGATLGPGGKQVLIERQEIGMKPIMTKDGVTVFKNLGYDSAVKQLILESARDAAIRTAAEAGDGTTTATILSSSIANATASVVRANNRLSPQKIVREMQALVPALSEKINSHKISINSSNYEEVLLRVASLSANSDDELAKKVIDAMDLVGEEGNMTIIEQQGPSRYEIERLNGYTIERGYEESCRNFSNGFINDKSGTLVNLDNPIFLLFDGVINDMMQVFEALTKLGNHFQQTNRHDRGVVLVAHGFSDSVIGDLHVNWNHPQSLVKVFPTLSQQNAIKNSATQFLYDLQAYVGSPVFNPIDRPVADLDAALIVDNSRALKFEGGRFRSTVIAKEDPEAISIRVNELKLQKIKPESEYELRDLEVRIGKLTSGIARMIIYGPSAAETREKRDRAEDAWMAIRGAVKYGAVPGGGYVLTRIAADLIVASSKMIDGPKKYATSILGEALIEPVKVLYRNYGYSEEEINNQIFKILNTDDKNFDLSEDRWVEKYDILDSVPAVTEAIRNSISIASLLGTIGGIVAFKRDYDTDKAEEKLVRGFESSIGERGSVNAS